MANKFDDALKLTLCFEGGKSDNPKDPGGKTNQGITQRTYDAYTARKGFDKRDVFDMQDPERDEIYFTEYWTLSGADRLPVGLDAAVFDFAVNSGVERAVKTLQKEIGATQDGIFGSLTLAAVPADYSHMIEDYSDARLSFMRSLSTWATFGDGWTTRVKAVEDYAFHEAKAFLEPDTHPVAVQPAPVPAAPKADPAQQVFLKTKQGVYTLVGSAGALAPVAAETADKLRPFIAHGSVIGEFALYGVVGLTFVGGIFGLLTILKPYIKTA